jgi:uroporphyrinogen-III synthase
LQCFEAAGISCRVIAPIEFTVLGDLEALRDLVIDNCCGIVLTSSTAVEALQILKNQDSENVFWESGEFLGLPVFVVGKATADSAKGFGFTNVMYFENVKNAQMLATEITVWYASSEAKEKGSSLVFLCSSIRRDELPENLKQEDIPLKELPVYHTQTSPSLKSKLDGLIQELDSSREWWMVFFSPSGANAVLESGYSLEQVTRFKIAAIGKTTAAGLSAKHFKVDSIAISPSPQALLEAIQSALSTS